MGGEKYESDTGAAARVAKQAIGGVVVLACVGCSSVSESGLSTTDLAPETSSVAVATSTSEGATSVLESGLAGFPEADDDVAAATVESLLTPVLDDWMNVARGAVTAESAPCDPAATLMSVETFEFAAGLADSVTAELMLNLDAALGAAAYWCSVDDADQAAAEFIDAQTIAAQLDQRIEAMGS